LNKKVSIFYEARAHTIADLSPNLNRKWWSKVESSTEIKNTNIFELLSLQSAIMQRWGTTATEVTYLFLWNSETQQYTVFYEILYQYIHRVYIRFAATHFILRCPNVTYSCSSIVQPAEVRVWVLSLLFQATFSYSSFSYSSHMYLIHCYFL
jgi:hypothetical protein